MKLLLPSDPCPNCEHVLGYHEEDGCLIGWAWDIDGMATVIGCQCNLRIVG